VSRHFKRSYSVDPLLIQKNVYWVGGRSGVFTERMGLSAVCRGGGGTFSSPHASVSWTGRENVSHHGRVAGTNERFHTPDFPRLDELPRNGRGRFGEPGPKGRLSFVEACWRRAVAVSFHPGYVSVMHELPSVKPSPPEALCRGDGRVHIDQHLLTTSPAPHRAAECPP